MEQRPTTGYAARATDARAEPRGPKGPKGRAGGRRRGVLGLPLLALAACAAPPPIATAPAVDLPRFMGDWYVQAHVPVGSERHAHNAVESYALDDRGRVLTSYVFREKAFDGDLEVMEPLGFVRSDSGAVWGMQFLWPFEAEYIVSYLDTEYTETIIARRKRDYAWVMTRDPMITPERRDALVERLVALGYDRAEVRVVPQRWPDPEHPASLANGDLARYTRK